MSRVPPGLRRAVIALLSTLVLLSLAPAPALAESSTSRHVLTQDTPSRGQIQREYFMSVPTAGPAQRPLVIVLHGRYQRPSSAMSYTGMHHLGAERGFVTVYPAAYAGGWNAGTCCETGAREDIPDVEFLDQVIADVQARTQIDPARVYLTGFSNGGMMAYRYACQRSDAVAGIAVVSGAMAASPSFQATLPQQCRPSHPVNLIHVHGASDKTVPYAGGTVSGSSSRVLDVPRSAATFASAAACSGSTTRRVGRANHRDYTGCAVGGRVKLVKIEALGHSWTRDSARDGFDTSVGVWNFLSTQPAYRRS